MTNMMDKLQKKLPGSQFDFGHKFGLATEKTLGYGPQPAPTAGASRAARSADPAQDFRLGLKNIR